MKKVSFILFILFFCMDISRGQEITGRLIGCDGESIGYAAVALFTLPDSTLVAGTISGEDGRFKISTPSVGTYMIRITALGHEPFFTMAESPCSIGDITMTASNNQLDAVVIKGDAIRHTTTGIIVDVPSLEYARDRNMGEVLPYMPGVSVVDGNIQILGETTTTFYVDGMRVGTPDAIKMLSSDRVLKLEIDYQAGSDESASTKGGVIRITTKKSPKGGFEGQVTGISTSQPANLFHKGEGYGELSITSGKLYIMNTAYASRGTPKTHWEDGSIYKTSDGLAYTADTRGKIQKTSIWDVLGVSYAIDTHNTLKGSLTYSRGKDKRDERSVASMADMANESTHTDDAKNQCVQAVATYEWHDGANRSLTADANYLYYDARESQSYDMEHSMETQANTGNTLPWPDSGRLGSILCGRARG